MQVLFDRFHDLVNCLHRILDFPHGVVHLGENAFHSVKPRKQQQEESGRALVMIRNTGPSRLTF